MSRDGVTVVSKGWLLHPPRKGYHGEVFENLFVETEMMETAGHTSSKVCPTLQECSPRDDRFADELNNNGSDWSSTTQLRRMAKDLKVPGCSNTVSLIPTNSGTWGEPGLWTRLQGHGLTWKGEVKRWRWTSILNQMIQQGKNRSECEWHFLSHSCVLLRTLPSAYSLRS